MKDSVITVVAIEWKDGKKGQYLVAQTGEGHKEILFDKELQNTFVEAYNAKVPLMVTKEQKGEYWNVVSAMITRGKAEEIFPEDKPSKEDKKGQEIAYHVCLKELGESLRTKLIDTDKPLGSYIRKQYVEIICKGVGIDLEAVKNQPDKSETKS